MPFVLKWDSTVPLGPPDTGRDHVHVFVDGNSNDYTVVGGTQFQIKDLSPGKHKVEDLLAARRPFPGRSEVGDHGHCGQAGSSPSTGDSGGLGY
jgi:hypothetical protein